LVSNGFNLCRYILEAPEMEIGDDERVEVPLLKDGYSSGGYRDNWGSGGGKKGGEAAEKSLEEQYGGEFVPNIRLPQNPLITVAGLTLAAGIAAYSTTLLR
jgi:hypothetical protein